MKNSFKQYIPNKLTKYGIKIFVLADNQSSYSLKSILYTGKEAHFHHKNINLPLPTKVIRFSGLYFKEKYNQKQLLHNYSTGKRIGEAGINASRHNKKKQKMHTLVVVQNATGTTYYGFNHKNNFNLLSTMPKKGKKVVFLSSVHSANSMREATRKEKTDVYYKRPRWN